MCVRFLETNSDDNTYLTCRPFVDFAISRQATVLQFFSDASVSGSKGFGCYFDREYMIGQWGREDIEICKPSIAYLELLPLCITVFVWSDKLANQRVEIACNNIAAVAMVNNTTSGCRNCMWLIRKLVLRSISQQHEGTVTPKNMEFIVTGSTSIEAHDETVTKAIGVPTTKVYATNDTNLTLPTSPTASSTTTTSVPPASPVTPTFSATPANESAMSDKRPTTTVLQPDTLCQNDKEDPLIVNTASVTKELADGVTPVNELTIETERETTKFSENSTIASIVNMSNVRDDTVTPANATTNITKEVTTDLDGELLDLVTSSGTNTQGLENASPVTPANVVSDPAICTALF